MQAEVGHGVQPHSGTSAPLKFRVTPSMPPSLSQPGPVSTCRTVPPTTLTPAHVWALSKRPKHQVRRIFLTSPTDTDAQRRSACSYGSYSHPKRPTSPHPPFAFDRNEGARDARRNVQDHNDGSGEMNYNGCEQHDDGEGACWKPHLSTWRATPVRPYQPRVLAQGHRYAEAGYGSQPCSGTFTYVPRFRRR